MKKQFSLFTTTLLLAIVSTTANAQKIQLSTVREQNSNKRPVPNAQVIFTDAVPATSDQSGNLRLVFQGRKAGDWVFLTEVQKAGYELVNNKEIEQLKLSGEEQLGADIVLAKAGVVDAAKKDYYDISDKSLLAGFEREKAKIRKELQEARLTAQQFEEQKKLLQEQYDNQKKELDVLAEKFARINFDDVDSLYRQALELFKDGKIDSAIEMLENADPFKLIEQIIGQEAQDADDQKKLDARKLATAKTKQKIIAQVRLLADMYGVKFNPAKAEALFDGLVRLDSTDLEILQDAADFYRENHRYEKALRVLPLVIAHPQAEDWQKANAHGHIGDMYFSVGRLELALQAYLTCQEVYTKMLHTDPNNSFFYNNLAISYSKLGNTHTSLGNLDKALIFFEERSRLSKELCEVYPQDVDFKDNLSVSYQNIGETHSSLGDLDKALIFFEKNFDLSKELYLTYPQNMDFKNGLAISYSSLGATHSSLGNLDKALSFFEESSRLSKELYLAYPQNMDFKNGLVFSYSKLGETHSSLGDLSKALTFFEESSRLSIELYIDFPQNVEFKNDLAMSYRKLGMTHTYIGNLDNALTFFEKGSLLSKELYDAFPQNVDFKNGLAISYSKIGETHLSLSDLHKALTFFEERSRLSKELYNAFPQNVDFKNGLAISCQFLGNTHTSLGNLDAALRHYEQYNQLSKELYSTFAQNVEFKYGLAVSYGKLGEINTSLGNLDKAFICFEVMSHLFEELHASYLQNVDFKNGLAVSYFRLGAFSQNQLQDITKAWDFFWQAETLCSELVREAPMNAQFQRFLDQVRAELAELYEDNPVFFLKDLIEKESDTLTQYQLHSILCDTLRQRVKIDPQQNPALAEALNNRAWVGFFLKKFEEVESDVREGMALDPDNKYLPSNLAPALLFQGKKDAALAEYKKWMDKPFNEDDPTYREVFLDDLKTFEKAGIIPAARMKDVAAVRKLLLDK
ncbi:MAG: tetratricopeptide repeat protein [Saprospiraceae bacterium]